MTATSRALYVLHLVVFACSLFGIMVGLLAWWLGGSPDLTSIVGLGAGVAAFYVLCTVKAFWDWPR